MSSPLLSADPRRAFLADQALLGPAIKRVLQSGWYVLGQECSTFEAAFASYVGVSGCLGTSSGMDALELGLRALGLDKGDEVVVTALTSSACATAVVRAGGVPVFADVNPETLTIDPRSISNVITSRTKVLMAVHLYGHPCDMDRLLELADTHNVSIIEDCAQSHGAQWRDKPVGSFGDVAAFSFYPTKNLAALGDGGALVSDDPDLTDRANVLPQYGWRERQVSAEVGMNSRLDELQAAVLSERLSLLDERNDRRRQIAERYRAGLEGWSGALPSEHRPARSVYHQYVIRSVHRDRLGDHLPKASIAPTILYPVPLHLQDAFFGYPRAESLEVSEIATQTLLCLPAFPELLDEEVDTVVRAIHGFSERY